jgi:hypothetical protein
VHDFDASRMISATLSLVGVLLVAGCAADDDEPSPPRTCADFEGRTELPDVPLTYVTEHLDIHVAEDFIMCAGTPAEYERFYQYVADELSIHLTQRVPVFMMSHGGRCPPASAGCRTPDGVVFTKPGATWHELVHAASCEWRYSSVSALVEGLAVALEPRLLTAKADPAELFDTDRDSKFAYDHAGHFTRWLLDEYGVEAFRQAYVASPLSGGEKVLEVLAEVYDQDADTLFADYLASAPYLWVPHRQCDDAPRLPPSDGGWTFEAIFDCDDPATFGPWERRGGELYSAADTSMYQSFLIDIETAGPYVFERDEYETGVFIERCLDQTHLSEHEAATVWRKHGLVPTLQGTTEVELEPSTYRIDVLREFAAPHPVSLRIEAKSP